MNIQIKLAIISILVVIPLSSIAVYGTESSLQLTPAENSKLQVISSFYPLHEFTQIVGGEKVDAILLVPAGVEPHDWEPTIKDVQRMQSADFIVINGIGFENWVDSLAENNYQGIIVDTSKGVTSKHYSDPHIWLNPAYAIKQVQNIALAFSNHDPENEEFYHANAVRYSEKLHSLDTKIRNELSQCNHDFITFHDSFSYFAKEYDLNQHTIIQTNNFHGEVTAKTLENTISIAKKFNVKVIFSEENISSKSSEVIANEIGANVLVLSTLESVSDGTYISKMTENLDNFKEALC